jgi:hypothetical protein
LDQTPFLNVQRGWDRNITPPPSKIYILCQVVLHVFYCFFDNSTSTLKQHWNGGRGCLHVN